MKRNYLFSLFIIVILLFVYQSISFADGMIITKQVRKIAPTRPPDSPARWSTVLAVKNHNVSVKIDNQVAITTVNQTFHNPTNMRLEGTYIFPFPENASISKLSM